MQKRIEQMDLVASITKKHKLEPFDNFVECRNDCPEWWLDYLAKNLALELAYQWHYEADYCNELWC